MAAVNLRHIEIFHAVVATESLTETTRLLHTSQPTVSRKLARLEKMVRLKLFECIHGRLYPTMQGLRLFREVQWPWYRLDCTVSAMESLREFRQGELSVTYLPISSQSFLPQLLQPFLARYPDVSLDIAPQESPLLKEWFLVQRHDLRLAETFHTPARIERTESLSLDEVRMLPPGHPLVVKKVLTPNDFQGKDYISLSCAGSYRQLLDQLFTEHQAKRHMVVETHSAVPVCTMVRARAGISVINSLTALDYAASGLVVRRFSIAAPFTVSPIRPLRCPSSALVQASSERLQAELPKLVTSLDAILSPATTA